jgi:isocitrate lyase
MSMSKALSFEDLVPSAPKGRFAGIRRPYSPQDVVRLRGSFPISYTLAERGANKLWQLLHERPYVHALGAVTGNQAMQMVRGGLEAIYLSGWQVAADANPSIQPIPVRSLPARSTALLSAPTRSNMPKAASRAIGSRRSWPTPRRGLAAR